MSARLLAVNVVHEVVRGPSRYTAIDKRPVDGPVEVGRLGLAGDKQCSKQHGGVDKALYAFASEDLEWWTAELGREIGPGRFGENLTTSGLDVNGARIGERWRIGRDVVVEVRMPCDSCANLAFGMGIPKFHRRFLAAGRPGAYLAVVSGGRIRAGDPIRVVFRPENGRTVAEVGGVADVAAQ
ncbi:MOSC domain-containing protein [Flindersiella endophytica]